MSISLSELHRYTITSEGASLGYFRLIEDPAGAWVTWAEVEAVAKALVVQPEPKIAEPQAAYVGESERLLAEKIAELTRQLDEAREHGWMTRALDAEARLTVLEAHTNKFIEAAEFYRCLHPSDERIVDAEVLMCHHRNELRALLAPSSPADKEQP